VAAQEQRRQRRQGRTRGDEAFLRRRGEIRWGGAEVGLWAALMGLLFDLRPTSSLLFFLLEAYDVYGKVYVCIWHHLEKCLES